MSTRQVYELFVRATPEQVWDAITRPDQTQQYFFGTRVALDGKSITYDIAGGPRMVDGDVIEVDAPKQLTTTWRVHYDPTAKGEVSRVTWKVEPRGEATLLTVIHDDLDDAPATARGVATGGWSLVLSGLKTLVETGQPLVVGQG